MQYQLQDSTPRLSSYQSSYHHPSQYFFEVSPIQVSSLYLPSAFYHKVFSQWIAASEVHPGMSYRLGYLTKNRPLIHCDGVSDGLFKLFVLFSCSFDVVYLTYLQVLTKKSCSYIISFVIPAVTKIFWPFFYTPKNPSSSSLSMLHCCFSALVYLHSSTYTWWW